MGPTARRRRNLPCAGFGATEPGVGPWQLVFPPSLFSLTAVRGAVRLFPGAWAVDPLVEATVLLAPSLDAIVRGDLSGTRRVDWCGQDGAVSERESSCIAVDALSYLATTGAV